MPYPPPVPPANRVNTTPSFDNHPGDHNAISTALTEIINVLGNDPAGGLASLTARLASLVPAGTMTQWGGTVAPDGWLLCEGQAILRSAYPALLGAIGTTYGVGDGTTTFNVPDCRGRVAVCRMPGDGVFGTIGVKGGSRDAGVVAHTHTGPSHTHPIDHDHGVAATSGVGDHTHVYYRTEFNPTMLAAGTVAPASNHLGPVETNGGGAHSHTVDLPPFGGASGAGGTGSTGSTGGAATNLNLMPYIGLSFIIRAV